MSERIKCVVGYDRAYPAILELIRIHEKPELREGADDFGRRMVEQGLRKPEEQFTWQKSLATAILTFLEEGGCTFALKCEDERRERTRAEREQKRQEATP